MAARTASRAVPAAYIKLALPSLPHPQLTGEEDVSALDEVFSDIQGQTGAGAEEEINGQASSAKSYDEEGMEVDGDGEQLEETYEAGLGVEEEAEELLDVADR